MDRNVTDKRLKEWGESGMSYFVGTLLILGIGMNIYDNLVHGYMLKIQPLLDLRATGQVLYLVSVCYILWCALDAIRGDKPEDYRLKLFPLLFQATLAGVILIYLGLLIGILLKMFMAEIIET